MVTTLCNHEASVVTNYNATTRIISSSSSDVIIRYSCVSSDLTVTNSYIYIYIYIYVCIIVSQAEVYQINTSRTLCTREEVVFICSNNNGPVIRCAATTVTGVHVSLGLHSKFTKLQEARIDSTSVRGEVIDANSSYFVTTITVVPPVSSTIVCNDETISYHLQNCKWSLF